MKTSTQTDHLRWLADLDEQPEPILSCMIDLRDGAEAARQRFKERAEALVQGSRCDLDRHFLEAGTSAVMLYLGGPDVAGRSGVAVYVRGGEHHFFQPILLDVPVVDSVTADTLPDLYPLAELFDCYSRLVVLVARTDRARIIEMSLGQITSEVLLERSELRERVGREWTHTHYRNSTRHRDQRFLKEKIETIRRLMGQGDLSHLVLTGDPKRVAMIRKLLPPYVLARTIDDTPAERASLEDPLRLALEVILEAEAAESHDTVDELFQALHKDDLAVIGPAPSLQALTRGRAVNLVISREGDLGTAHICADCGWAAVGDPAPSVCAECPSHELVERQVRPELIRLAQRRGCPVETVPQSDALASAGGVGCVLRYKPFVGAQEERQVPA